MRIHNKVEVGAGEDWMR